MKMKVEVVLGCSSIVCDNSVKVLVPVVDGQLTQGFEPPAGWVYTSGIEPRLHLVDAELLRADALDVAQTDHISGLLCPNCARRYS